MAKDRTRCALVTGANRAIANLARLVPESLALGVSLRLSERLRVRS